LDHGVLYANNIREEQKKNSCRVLAKKKIENFICYKPIKCIVPFRVIPMPKKVQLRGEEEENGSI
jgi:hypothetical protein